MMGLLKFRNKIVGSVLVGLVTGSCVFNSGPYIKNTYFGGALGTSYSITTLYQGELNLEKEIDSVFTVINNSMSTYIPDSDISKINRGESEIIVDQMFRDVFELSKEVYNSTNGSFDPTVGALVNAWGFGPAKQQELDSVKVDSILQFVGFEKVSLTEEGTVIKKDPRIFFDFNAIAKGYAIDRLAALLDQKEIENYLIEVGGEIVAKGENKLKNKSWIVGIDDPQVEEGRRLKITLQLRDRALASSGNYRKFRVDSVTGKKYVHTIDPKTGFTKNGRILSASVISNTCARADAYATAFMVMELPETKDLLETVEELEAYIIYFDENGEVNEFMTPDFKKLVVH